MWPAASVTLLWPCLSLSLPCTLKLWARMNLVSVSSFLSFFQEVKAVWLLITARSLSSSKPQSYLKYSILESKWKHPSPWHNSFIKPDSSFGMLGWGKDRSPNTQLLGTLISCWESYLLLWRIQNRDGEPLGSVVCMNGLSIREQ